MSPPVETPTGYSIHVVNEFRSRNLRMVLLLCKAPAPEVRPGGGFAILS